ncbi:CRP/FNR family transcriptional regulator [Dyadobacter sp. BE34]|uniref:CRP/FNR family transcriptional regulator n=1 Tax=Dyadobacter fermentans TaxID=94254 RepID=A0ABU1R892_9BACT|nr:MULTISPECIES: Crp/Fnr family transcriptional regulator [Dyadobacter]MDR6809613.1 CRP/FNR family transcriptional regulator [Dyadobacter fermentans]MDR7047291.1 CRP/FNR family transcriptional regulator [Dyadobacter sp. BE242]MDR7201527.1 CRP/FNR family transcriptional regulator [Dyadobacter sp. BE34]MDR7219397.1 CRP/FNR family transcriptional regulator [Dyadobacter sp. BE31]MDR7267209.1 CRP/FNR family transcriptional regulator [Dyadobacter sp. BE32]
MNMHTEQAAISQYLETYFSQFEPELIRKLAENSILRDFEGDEQLMRPGQYFKSTMLIVEGGVKLYREGQDGNEFFIYQLGPGDACALSMICATKKEQSQISARAVEPTRAILIPIALMDELMTSYKSWYYFVLETYRSRFEELLQVVDGIAFRSMDERLEFYLKNQQKLLHNDEIPITHQQIASDLNSSREVISRLLKKMEQRGMVRLGRNTIKVLRNFP